MLLMVVSISVCCNSCILDAPGPSQKQNPEHPVTYKLNIILAQAEQELSGNTIWESWLLSVSYSKWESFTMNGTISNRYNPWDCDPVVDSLETLAVEDTTMYRLYSPTLDAGISYHDPYVNLDLTAPDRKRFLMRLKKNAIDRIDISGKCAVIVNTGQIDGNLLTVPEPHWDNLPSSTVLGESCQKKDSNGDYERCNYTDSFPTGAVYTRTLTVLYYYLEEEVQAMAGAYYDSTAWKNDPPAEYSWTKYVHRTFAHELGHQLGCWYEHNEGDEYSNCCMRWPAWVALTYYNWEEECDKRLFAVCYCDSCANRFCAKTVFKE